MKVLEKFNGPLKGYVNLDNLDKIFHLEDCDFSHELYESNWLAPAIERVLFDGRPGLPEQDEEIDTKFVHLFDFEPKTLMRIGLIVSALSNAGTLAKITDGSFLRHIETYSGVKNFAQLLRRYKGGQLSNLVRENISTASDLEEMQSLGYRTILGALPPPYLDRYALHHPMEDIEIPIPFAEEEDQRQELFDLIEYALSLFVEQSNEKAEGS